ncbi:MAG: NAD(P)/FAD-dependent oxidoreductase [Bacteroidales bacterium]|nr:NAD(P)/FAD-dependent oxidoreductase [Bacteroidales bacterium]
MNNNDKSVIIIGAGFAGLATGIYALMNGYKTEIFEMHNLPGGLCTSWDRKGYTFDGCIHWLVGSNPKSGMHDMWEETGVIQNRPIINMDEYFRVEDSSGRTVVFYNDVDRLEKHLLEFSPKDEKPIKRFAQGIRMCIPFDSPSKHDPFYIKIKKQIRSASIFIANGKKMQDWMKITAGDFAKEFSDPLLAEAFRQMWIPEFSMFFMLFTFAYLHTKNAGYPIGGSKPMALALEAKYKELGGKINYKKRVSRILTSQGKATGIRLDDGNEHTAGRVISAADGHATIFDMLEGKYADKKVLEPYEKWPRFASLLYVSLGVNRRFDEVAKTVSGMTFKLKEPVMIADKMREWLSVHIFNQDSTLAPDGKTVLNVMLESDYYFWKSLAENRKNYDQKKDEAAKTIISLLEQRFPGITPLVEVTDVATPLTFERYTGNWNGSFEGWLITPENSGTLMKPMSQTLPGLDRFYMCGQWVEPGGGLPTALMSAKRLVKKICKEDGKKFRC